MPPFANGYLVSLLQTQESPCISIYLPTERTYPASQQSPIRYRNLVDQAEESLRMKYTGAQVRKLMEPFRAVAEDLVFWTHRVDGLAILGSPTRFEVLDLHRPVPERVIVAESFHLKPLLRIAQSADRFHVLCLQRDAARLYEGNRDVLHPIEAPGVPLTMTAAQREAVGVQSKEQVLSGKSAGKPSPTSRGPSAPPGPLATRGDGKLDGEHFFRAVDRAVWEHVSRPTELPLVVAALAEHQAAFRAVSYNPRLLLTGIEKNPASLSDDELRAAAWKCVEPSYLARLQKFTEDYQVARTRGLASDAIPPVARAALDGRVGILLVEADRVVPGRIDPATGAVQETASTAPDVDDLLDDLAEQTLRSKGTVVVVPKERMPTATGLAAIYRF